MMKTQPFPDLEALIALTPDFPQKGVLFRDISPLLATRFADVIDAMSTLFDADEIARADHFAGIDARGFVFAAALAARYQKNMLMIRKGGKLPPPSFSESYALEYGQATLELKPGAGGRVIIVDDVLATGGTMRIAANLCTKSGYEVIALTALINLTYLNDFNWHDIRVRTVFQY